MKSFVVQPFGQRVYVTSCTKEFVRKYNRFSDPKDHMHISEFNECMAMAGMPSHSTRGTAFIIYCPQDCPVGYIFHEALHMAHYLMAYTGTPIEMASTETQAYLMQHIGEMVMEKLL